MSQRWRGIWRSQSSEPRDGIYRLSLSPDGKLVAAVHYSSTLSIWHVPSLRLKQSWQLGLQVVASVLCMSALTLLVGRQEGHPACKNTEWWGADVVICLERGANCIWPS